MGTIQYTNPARLAALAVVGEVSVVLPDTYDYDPHRGTVTWVENGRTWVIPASWVGFRSHETGALLNG